MYFLVTTTLLGIAKPALKIVARNVKLSYVEVVRLNVTYALNHTTSNVLVTARLLSFHL
jgi:hypothetical protein